MPSRIVVPAMHAPIVDLVVPAPIVGLAVHAPIVGLAMPTKDAHAAHRVALMAVGGSVAEAVVPAGAAGGAGGGGRHG
jgi:hypothetical protein